MVASPSRLTEWGAVPARGIVDLLGHPTARWWLSGGVALDHWLGRLVRPRANVDISTTAGELRSLMRSLPADRSAWVADGVDFIPLSTVTEQTDVHPILIHDDLRGVWVLQVNIEDGSDRIWMYRRDPRLQLPWDRAVLDIDGIPTGAPELQLVWKALRPRPEDELDKDAVLPELSDEARAWWERAILTVHPHSTWSIHVRSPSAPAKASWNRPGH